MTSIATTQIPGYVVGTWDIDASHSTVGFSVRHMMVARSVATSTQRLRQDGTARPRAQPRYSARIETGASTRPGAARRPHQEPRPSSTSATTRS